MRLSSQLTSSLLALSLLALSLLACSEAPPAPSERALAAPGTDVLGDEIVATVDGHGIARAALEHGVRETGVPAPLVLQRLEDETLLARAAAAAGFDDDPAVERATRQALVQALLAREAEAAPIDISDAQVEEAFQQSLARWELPERRASVHLLVRGPDEAVARAQAEQVLAEVRRTDDPAEALRARLRSASEDDDRVSIEEVPAMSRQAPADPVYLDALFTRPDPGLVDEVVHSSFGFHVLVITEVLPAYETPRDEALATLRQELEAAERGRWTHAWIQSLVATYPVEVRPDVHQRLVQLGEGS